jgi:biopolymer transport protein ExbD
MRIPNSRDRDDLRDERSMTAMIDVVFLLLIFFVCASVGQMGELLLGSRMIAGAAVSPEVPKPDVAPDRVWVTVRRRDGKTAVEARIGEGRAGREFRQREADKLRNSPDYPELVAMLKGLAETAPEIPVILDVEHGVPMGDHLAVLTAAKNAGFRDIKFATERGKAVGKRRKAEGGRR